MSKYLIFDLGGVFNGEIIQNQPSLEDLFLFKIDENISQIIKNGKQVVR